MLFRHRLSCATQESAIAWFQRLNACATSPAAIRSSPAIFLRHGDAEQALRADLWERVLGPPLLRVHANGQAVQFGAREAVGLVEDEVLFGVEFEGRRAIVADRDGVARSQAFLPSRGAAQGARRSR